MIRKLPWVLLGLSIAFNFFFAGGFLHARSTYERAQSRPEVRTDLLGERLDLTDEQRRAYEQIRRDASERALQLRLTMYQARQEMWDRVGQAPNDPQTVRELAEFEAEQGRQLRLLAAEGIREFMKVLRPDQREKLSQWGRQHGAGVPPWLRMAPASRSGDDVDPPWQNFQKRMLDQTRKRMLDQFDIDGDGKLSDSERAAVRRLLDTWRPNGGAGLKSGLPKPSQPSPAPATRTR